MVRTAPGITKAMTPPHAHWQVDPAVSAGFPPIKVWGAPGFHGVVTGTHGIGVSTPRAALVAAATVGLARLVHMPNGGTFTRGAKSVIVAAGRPSMTTREAGKGASDEGAIPKLHWISAPSTALGGMSVPPYSFEPFTDEVRVAPVVVTKQITFRSSACVQLRADGNRYVKNSFESR